MIQVIITISIISVAVAAGIFLTVRKIRQMKKPDPCKGCNTSCGDCALYKEMQKKKHPVNGKRDCCS
jgi:hypothetical protein